MASPGNRHCANCIGTLSFTIVALRYSGHESRTSDTQLTYIMVVRMSADDAECVVDWVMVDVDLGDRLRRAACHPALVDVVVQHHRCTCRHNRVLATQTNMTTSVSQY